MVHNFQRWLIINEGQSDYGLWDKVIDFFIPGTPVKDGRDLLATFDAIITRRIEYNKKNKLPLDTLTKEEKEFREKILKATPNFGYPDIYGLSKIIQDINQGKNIQPSEFNRYKKLPKNSEPLSDKPSNTRSPEELSKRLGSRQELKKMWLGIDEPGGDSKGFWVKSKFKPQVSKNPNDLYYMPSEIPKLTSQQFDELYKAVMDTKLPNGKFPGGNSSTIWKNIKNYKYINKDLYMEILGDLGNFKLGAGEENGKKFISFYDEWDLVPPSAKKFGVDVQKYGKTPLIYHRIYK